MKTLTTFLIEDILKKNKNHIIFTGRIRREYKLLNNIDLIKNSKVLRKLSNYILRIKLNKYHHFIINQEKLINLSFMQRI